MLINLGFNRALESTNVIQKRFAAKNPPVLVEMKFDKIIWIMDNIQQIADAVQKLFGRASIKVRPG